jgi:GntR family transcriptional regulator
MTSKTSKTSKTRKTKEHSLVHQTAEVLRCLINTDLSEAERLPPESELADRLCVSRPTLREALSILWHEGLVQKRWGVGTVIVRRGAARPVHEHLSLPLVDIKSTPNQIRDSGSVPGVQALSISKGTADARVASLLDLEAGTPIWIVDRVHTADDQPLLRSTDLLPQVINGKYFDATRYDAVDNPLLDLLRNDVGCVVDYMAGNLSAVSADAETARLLAVCEGSPLLRLEQTNYANRKTVIFGVSFHRADKAEFRFQRAPAM